MRKPRAVHSIESLLARCIEEGDCFLWSGYQTNSTPQVHKDGKMVAVRRLMLDLQGIQITGKYVATTCQNPLCVNPDHIVQHTALMHMKRMAKAAHTGDAKVRHEVGVRKWRRANPLKLDEVKAAAIRNDTRPKDEVAKDYDIDPSMVWKIRSGLLWRDYANPFAALII